MEPIKMNNIDVDTWSLDMLSFASDRVQT